MNLLACAVCLLLLVFFAGIGAWARHGAADDPFPLCLAVPAARAVEVRLEPVADQAYAFVGELGARTAGNEGLNTHLGLVVTPAGAVLIDSGATWQGARQAREAVRRVTAQPVKWVVNIGGQDRRWLGNGWFQALGAQIIGHAQGGAALHNRGNDQLAALRATPGDKIDGTVPVLPTRWLAGGDESLVPGGVVFEFRHRRGAQTPGDMLVWLPQQRALFSGDMVYVDRLLGVIPVSNTRAWLASFGEIEALAPMRIVTGHGRVTDLATARADTRDYLVALRKQMQQAVGAGQEIGAAVESLDGQPYLRLLNAADLMSGNASRT